MRKIKLASLSAQGVLFLLIIGILAGCGSRTSTSELPTIETPQSNESTQQEDVISQSPVEQQESSDDSYSGIVGSWTLDVDRTDSMNTDNLFTMFGSSISYGYNMSFMPDGTFTYGIAAGHGGEGTYTINGDSIVASIVTYENQQSFELPISIHGQGDSMYLVLEKIDTYSGDYMDYNLVWIKEGTAVQDNSEPNETISNTDAGNDQGEIVDGIYVPGFADVERAILNDETIFTFGKFSSDNVELTGIVKQGFEQNDYQMQYKCEISYKNSSGNYVCYGTVEFERTATAGWHMVKAWVTGLSTDFPELSVDGDTGMPYVWFGKYYRMVNDSVLPQDSVSFSSGTPGILSINDSIAGDYICSPSIFADYDFQLRYCRDNGLTTTWQGINIEENDVIKLFELGGLDGDVYMEKGVYANEAYLPFFNR